MVQQRATLSSFVSIASIELPLGKRFVAGGRSPLEDRPCLSVKSAGTWPTLSGNPSARRGGPCRVGDLANARMKRSFVCIVVLLPIGRNGMVGD